MQSRIQADTDIVFVTSTGAKNSIVTGLKDKKRLPDILQIGERVAKVYLGTGRAGRGRGG
jgi:hypothetical protein